MSTNATNTTASGVGPSPPPPNTQQKSIQDLPIETLNQLKKTFEVDIRTLESSITALSQALDRYTTSLATARSLGPAEPQKLLIPLTSSMYAHGVTLGDGKLMVDLGTGFFAKMDSKDAEQVLERRIAYVRKNIEAFKKQYAVKRQNYDAVSEELQSKIQQRVGQQELNKRQ